MALIFSDFVIVRLLLLPFVEPRGVRFVSVLMGDAGRLPFLLMVLGFGVGRVGVL